MDALLQLAQRAANIDENAILIAVLANPDLQKKILDLNRINQLFDKGIDSTGRKLSDIGGDYSPFTLDLAIKEGRPKKSADHIDLHDTGEFYESFYIVLGGEEFEIKANPVKDDTNLFEEWGADIMGLTDESLAILSQFVKELMVPVIKQYLLYPNNNLVAVAVAMPKKIA
jgi:hypothetical protein